MTYWVEGSGEKFHGVYMSPATMPLTWATALTSWRWDVGVAILLAATAVAYVWIRRRAVSGIGQRPTGRHCAYLIVGDVLLIIAMCSAIGVYAPVLFWARALQVLLLLFVIPFFLAMSRPFSAVRGALSLTGRSRFDRALATPVVRTIAHPATTSAAMLATPWMLYLTPWYVASLRHAAVGATTSVLLMVIGFCYFYARLQADPVPHRYSAALSLIISIVESLSDGLLGLVLWLGPLIAVDYYRMVGRPWGPSLRVDQSIGAGVLWLVGDLLGLGFIVVLARTFANDERATARAVDEELDAVADHGDQVGGDTDQSTSTLWWENDPQLRERMNRRD